MHPSSLALSPDGRTLYSGGWSWDGEASHSVVALDAATGAVRAWGPTGGGGAIAVSPDGGTVYAGVSGYALALDAATLAERWRTPGNWETTDIALTPGWRQAVHDRFRAPRRTRGDAVRRGDGRADAVHASP